MLHHYMDKLNSLAQAGYIREEDEKSRKKGFLVRFVVFTDNETKHEIDATDPIHALDKVDYNPRYFEIFNRAGDLVAYRNTDNDVVIQLGMVNEI